ncbi:MAG: divergent PAP2 family protein [Butyrivibrio sp.]|nr:divergent PAP2 family protein [Butyrivibrio sp.]
MQFWNDILGNKVLVAACSGWFVAQVLKTILYVVVNKSFNPERLKGDGGMPSSHSATVMAVVSSTCVLYGASSFEFAISAVLALIVMHDAMGVRWETGIQAKVINNMMDWFLQLDKDIPVEEKLKEFVGHTPMQVLFGALLGTLIGYLMAI